MFNVTAAEEATAAEKPGPAKPVEAVTQSTSGIEDLFKDTTLVSPSLVPEKPVKDVKNDIMSLFEKVNIALSLLRCDIVLFSKVCYFSILTYAMESFVFTSCCYFQLKELLLLFYFNLTELIYLVTQNL